MTFDQSLGGAIGFVRRGRGMDQRSMAMYLCMSAPSLSRVESGKRPLTVRELYCCAAHLEISPESLLEMAEKLRSQVFSIDESKAT
ncbi:helix-turn-helix domain-containing protein [Marinobacter azerbaijanicus]|uniref:helix-turn-helix domain-containing protein n=1 Tax=Marinobacter azerbaijanicus TaxID=3050455 RepID=UPI003BF56C89